MESISKQTRFGKKSYAIKFPSPGLRICYRYVLYIILRNRFLPKSGWIYHTGACRLAHWEAEFYYYSIQNVCIEFLKYIFSLRFWKFKTGSCRIFVFTWMLTRVCCMWERCIFCSHFRHIDYRIYFL